MAKTSSWTRHSGAPSASRSSAARPRPCSRRARPRLRPSDALAQPVELLRAGVLRAVDDPQVLPATALHARLHQAALAVGHAEAGVRLDHHALAAGRGQRQPPVGRGRLGGRVGQVHDHPPGRGEQRRVGRDQPVGERQVPAVVPAGVRDAGAGQHRERRQRHAGQPVGRPHVRAVRRRVAGDLGGPQLAAGRAARRRRGRAPAPRPAPTGRPAARPGRPRRPRRTARGSGRRPWPTRAAARCRAAASRCPARRTARRRRPRARGPAAARRRSAKNGRPVRVQMASPGAGRGRPAYAPAREPMCFSSHTTRPTPAPRRSANAVAGCSRYPVDGRGRARRHRRRQPDQRRRVEREPAHHLQRGGGVLGGDGGPAVPVVEVPAAGDVGQVEPLVGRGAGGDQRADRRVVLPRGRHRHQLAGGQRSAVSVPPNTQPVSRQIVLLIHSGSGSGVWP